MSIIVPIDPIPNQKFSVLLEDVRYAIVIQDVGQAMAVTIEKDDVVLVSSALATAGSFIIPYQHLSVDGNFAFSGAADEIPFYTNFNVTQQLFYFTASEVANGTAT